MVGRRRLIGRGLGFTCPMARNGDPVSVKLELAPRGRRALDERLFLALPGFFRTSSRRTFRLPIRSRFRRRLLTRNVLVSYQGQNRDDWNFTFLLYDDRSELQNVPIAGGGSQVAGVGFSYQGVDGAKQLAADWKAPWASITFEPVQMVDAGDKILVLSYLSARGRGSGIEVREPLAQLIEFEDGMVRRQRNWLGSWVDGFEAAGVSEAE